MLVVLVGLDCDRCQRCIALDALRLPQESVSGRKASVEQVDNINLGAGGGQGIKIKIMDVDITLAISLCLLRCQQVCLVVGFGSCCANLQHTAHRGVAVDVGVVSLDVALARIHLGDFVDGFHQTCICLADTCAVCTIKDVLLCRLVKAHSHQLMFDNILYFLNLRRGLLISFLQAFGNGLCNRRSALRRGVSGCLHRLLDSGKNLALVKINDTSVSFDNFIYHLDPSCP